jgi:hypothetical protein
MSLVIACVIVGGGGSASTGASLTLATPVTNTAPEQPRETSPVPAAVATPTTVAPSILARVDAAILKARELEATGDGDRALELLDALARDRDVTVSGLARDLIARETKAVLRRWAASTKLAPRVAEEAKPTDEPETPEETPKAASAARRRSTVEEVRVCAAALDIDAARALLSGLDPDVAAREGALLDARATYLAALAASTGPATIDWSKLGKSSVAEIIATHDAAAAASPLGAALVAYDVGLWLRGDQRAKEWIDANAGDRSRGLEIVARARGVSPEGLVFRQGEFLTPGEDQRRASDRVTLDGTAMTRDEARKSVEKRRKQRTTNAPDPEAKAASEKLLRDWGVTDVRTILSSGDPAKRADIVVISDGFAREDVPRFEQIAAGIAKAFLTIEPFRNYSRYVNVHRITVVEEKSGIGGTRLGSRIENGGLSCDPRKAREYGKLAPDCDLVIVCANVLNARSSGYPPSPHHPGVITLRNTGEVDAVVLHELGHAFAGLDDEYENEDDIPQNPDFSDAEESEHVNVTRVSDPRLCKWHYWLLPPAPLAAIACFEGGYYRTRGYYRPAKTCRMRDKYGSQYCSVCLEAIEKQFYERLEPIDDFSPKESELVLWRGEPARFEATTIAIESGGEQFGSFTARWFVDGRAVAGKSAGIKTELELREPGPGEHEVACRVELHDRRVRRDDGLLASSRAWRLKVVDAPRPRIDAPERLTVRRGELVAFDVSFDGGGADLELTAAGPSGMSFVGANRRGRFVWIPSREARGAFRATFGVGKGAERVERGVDIVVQDEGHEVPPLLGDAGVIRAIRGRPLEFAIPASDADGDALVYTSTRKLPLGATLDAQTGVLRWTPGFAAFDSDVEIGVRVSDGLFKDERTFKIHVANRAIEKPTSAFELLVATRSPDPDVRQAAVSGLVDSHLALSGKLLELARLLRDAEPAIATRALEDLRSLTKNDAAGAEADRSVLVLDLAEHVWDFTDRKPVLAFVRDLIRAGPFSGEVRTASARIERDLAAVERYNRERGR